VVVHAWAGPSVGHNTNIVRNMLAALKVKTIEELDGAAVRGTYVALSSCVTTDAHAVPLGRAYDTNRHLCFLPVDSHDECISGREQGAPQRTVRRV
jgi:hypothetical protein